MPTNTTDSQSDLKTPFRVVIVGAGITGLAAAYDLTSSTLSKEKKLEVIVLERAEHAGGIIRTHKINNLILEEGPDMFSTENPAALNLCKELGLEKHIVETNQSLRRSFIAFNKRLDAVPQGFFILAPSKLLPFFTSNILSLRGKLRLAGDLFIPPKKQTADESLAQFVLRRFGQEALDRVAQPMLAGIYTADAHQLSLRATMPRFLELEQNYGSVIRGLKATKKEESLSSNNNAASLKNASGARYGIFASLNQGLGMLVNQLTTHLPPETIQYNCSATALETGKQGKPYDISLTSGTALAADAIILTTPSYKNANLIKNLDQDLANNLNKIPYASVVVLNLIYDRLDIPHPLNGFGFVVPASEKRNIVACSFYSVKWTGRCSPDKVILRVFMGGTLHPDLLELSDAHLQCLAWEDLHTYLGITAKPDFALVSRYTKAMPQYHLGHLDLLSQINNHLTELPGIEIAGNATYGVGISDCITSGKLAASKILDFLITSPHCKENASLFESAKGTFCDGTC